MSVYATGNTSDKQMRNYTQNVVDARRKLQEKFVRIPDKLTKLCYDQYFYKILLLPDKLLRILVNKWNYLFHYYVMEISCVNIKRKKNYI